MPSATEECRKTSGKCRRISRCLESGHAEHSEGGIVFNSVCLCVCVCVSRRSNLNCLRDIIMKFLREQDRAESLDEFESDALTF